MAQNLILVLLLSATFVSATLREHARRGLARAPAPAAPAAGKPRIQFDDELYNTESWHKEWEHGDWPGWKLTNTHKEEYKVFDERQSDGKASAAKDWWTLAQTGRVLAAAPAAAAPAAGKPRIQFDDDLYNTESWHKEWEHGDWPGWKMTNTHKEEYKVFDEPQSDGKHSPAKDWWTLAQTGARAIKALRLQRGQRALRELAAAPAPAGPAAAPVPRPQYDHDGFGTDWHEEWKNGDYPGYKITNPEAVKWEDRQSDGKQSPPGGLFAQRARRGLAAAPAPPAAPAAAPVPRPQYDHDGFGTDWHEEWKNGDYPGYKITNPEAVKWEDRQSDGKQSPPGR